MNILQVLVFFLIPVCCFAQNPQWQKGAIVDAVEIDGSDETFAVYVPNSFQEQVPSAIIFVFDPRGKGAMGLANFTLAAEKFNYILVGSNHTRNHFNGNFDVVNRLFTSVFNRFNINERLVYTAGFSGGSRLATSVATLTNQMAGVIACGAGMPSHPSELPNMTHKFSYVGLVGTRDMNYQEMRALDGFLSKIQIENELFIGDYVHEWPSEKEIVKALTWLELQAYKDKGKEVNPNFIASEYKKWYQEALTKENKGKEVSAVLSYERLVRSFSNYFATDSIEARIAQLKKQKSYKKEIKREKSLAKEEESLKTLFYDRFTTEMYESPPPKNIDWWGKKVNSFQQKYEDSEATSKGMKDRMMNYLQALAFESATVQQQAGAMDKVLYCHRLLIQLTPNESWPYFIVAKDHATLGNEEEMLHFLGLAVDKGWTNTEALLNSVEFEKFLDNESFKVLLNRMVK